MEQKIPKSLKFILNRQTVEDMLAHSEAMRPAAKANYKGFEIYIADGFSFKPEHDFKRFGVEEGEFPFGCFCTLWFIGRDETRFDVGAPMIFDLNHDPSLDASTKRKARINTAKFAAMQFINTRKKIASEGNLIHANPR